MINWFRTQIKEMTFSKAMGIVFIALYILVSIVSITHLFSFLHISDTPQLAFALSVAYSLGMAASIFALFKPADGTRRYAIAGFILLILMEVLGNVYHVYTHSDLNSISKFSELFGLTTFSEVAQKRIFSFVLGLPIVLIAVIYIEILGKTLRNKEQEVVDNTDQINELNEKISELTKEIGRISVESEERINEIKANLEEADQQITELKEEIEDLESKLEFEYQKEQDLLDQHNQLQSDIQSFENSKELFKEKAAEKYLLLKQMQKGVELEDEELLTMLGVNAFEGTKDVLTAIEESDVEQEDENAGPIIKTVVAKQKEDDTTT